MSAGTRPGGTSHRRGDGEEGVALVTVIGMSFVLMIMVVAATAYATNTMPMVRHHEDWNAALAAADAGIDDALHRLNQNSSYWATPDPDNPALEGWRELPGLASDASYHYRLDASQVGQTGAIDVTATGRVGDRRRTVEVRLRREGFLDNIYFTDFEASDPFALTTNAGLRTHLDSYCAVYHPDRDTEPINDGGCSTIRFAPGDVLEGPTRSNDALLIRSGDGGPRFLGRVVTGWNWEAAGSPLPYLVDAGSQGEPEFQDGVEHRPRLDMPESSQRVAQQAEATGCRYEGPTYVRFHVAGTQPRMTVISPLTDPADVNPGCGTGTMADGTPSGGIHATVDLPDGQPIHVRNSERSATGHPLGMPRPFDNMTTYSSTAGDVFVHGELDGQVTLAAENDVVIVWDLTYHDVTPESSNLLGLIADNNVWIYHPVWRQGPGNYHNLSVAHKGLPPFRSDPANPFPGDINATFPWPGAVQWEDPEIHAAILALNRSFGVQAFRRGDPFSGDLTVIGAIAQRWRGPVATSNDGNLASGYLKDYRYDSRLQFLTPPYFLEPEMAPWNRRRWSEIDVPSACGSGQSPQADGCLPAG